VASFIFFAVSMTVSGQIPKFLSLESSNSDQICQSVPIEVKDWFEGDMLGNWETSPDFQQNNSVYTIKFGGAAITNDVYRSTMLKFNKQLKALSQKAATRDSG
jgi:hypothetical protein